MPREWNALAICKGRGVSLGWGAPAKQTVERGVSPVTGGGIQDRVEMTRRLDR